MISSTLYTFAGEGALIHKKYAIEKLALIPEASNQWTTINLAEKKLKCFLRVTAFTNFQDNEIIILGRMPSLFYSGVMQKNGDLELRTHEPLDCNSLDYRVMPYAKKSTEYLYNGSDKFIIL